MSRVCFALRSGPLEIVYGPKVVLPGIFKVVAHRFECTFFNADLGLWMNHSQPSHSAFYFFFLSLT
jgi:hypothetical protein